MDKKKAYSNFTECRNCGINHKFEIPMGATVQNSPLAPGVLCTHCGCRLDGKPMEPEPGPKLLTAGQEWANTRGRYICPLFGEEGMNCGNKTCKACKPALAKAFDIGQSKLQAEPAMTAEEWWEQRICFCFRAPGFADPNSFKRPPWCDKCSGPVEQRKHRPMAIAAIANYIELNKDKVIAKQ